MTAIGAATPALAIPAQANAAATKYVASVNFQYGTIKTTITVSGKKLASVGISYAPDSPRSQQLDVYALPILQKEVLKADTYKVHLVSGVSFTSMAFEQSLHSAMLKAHIISH
jgi:uncharacterized protein with FMN-binding domain